jgi:hypothetical protein
MSKTQGVFDAKVRSGKAFEGFAKSAIDRNDYSRPVRPSCIALSGSSANKKHYERNTCACISFIEY